MVKNEISPSESEWLIMETLWASNTSLTSSEVSKRLEGKTDMTLRMVRVLMNRLCQKGLLDFMVDKKDTRVYHYFTLKSREECLKEKSRRFMDSYFSGSPASAVAALLESAALTDEQIEELERILERGRKKKG